MTVSWLSHLLQGILPGYGCGVAPLSYFQVWHYNSIMFFLCYDLYHHLSVKRCYDGESLQYHNSWLKLKINDHIMFLCWLKQYKWSYYCSVCYIIYYLIIVTIIGMSTVMIHVWKTSGRSDKKSPGGSNHRIHFQNLRWISPSIQWIGFVGKILTGKPHMSWKNLWFPVEIFSETNPLIYLLGDISCDISWFNAD